MARTASCECPPRSKQRPTIVGRAVHTTVAGSTATTYPTTRTIPCRWVRKSGREEQVYGARRVRRRWEAEVDSKADIERGDRCTFEDATGEHTVYVVDTAVDENDDTKVIVEADEIT